MKSQKPKGTKDVLPGESAVWQSLEAQFRKLAGTYGYQEIRTPTFESVEVFERSAGDTSEIVEKQMFRFQDMGGRHVALKPESTAPAMRMLIENGMTAPGVFQRLYYISSPHFRQESPQLGRLREHHQCGVELVGVSSIQADAEVIEIFWRYLESVGVPNPVVSINTLGDAECRTRYQAEILNHFAPFIQGQPAEEQARVQKNPLRLLDRKDEELQELKASAPSILDFLSTESRERFERLQTLLTEAGVQFKVDDRIVRGLDYYTEVVFECLRDELGSQSAIGAGGRYDNLIKLLGGSAMPSVGFGVGMERVVIVLEKHGKLPEAEPVSVFVVAQADVARPTVAQIARDLRQQGISAVYDLEGNSLKSQMRQADKIGCRAVIVIGENEIETGELSLKWMATGEQIPVRRDELASVLK